MTSTAIAAAAAVYFIVGSFYVADYVRFTHGQALIDDQTAKRLLESKKRREYFPLVVLTMVVFAGWPVLMVLDIGKWLVNAFPRARKTGE